MKSSQIIELFFFAKCYFRVTISVVVVLVGGGAETKLMLLFRIWKCWENVRQVNAASPFLPESSDKLLGGAESPRKNWLPVAKIVSTLSTINWWEELKNLSRRRLLRSSTLWFSNVSNQNCKLTQSVAGYFEVGSCMLGEVLKNKVSVVEMVTILVAKKCTHLTPSVSFPRPPQKKCLVNRVLFPRAKKTILPGN